MQNKRKNALKIALLGMDDKARKTLTLYFQGPCKSAHITIADGRDANVDIVDADTINGRILLDEMLAKELIRPLIVMSLNAVADERLLYVQKPIQTETMLTALTQAGKLLQNPQQWSAKKRPVLPEATPSLAQDNEIISPIETASPEEERAPPLKHYVADLNENRKKSKHKTAMLMDEQGFSALMGGLKPIDIDNRQQLVAASYNPKDYFQGYLQSAFKIALAKGQALQLNSGWKQLLIFPRSNEVWLDADDKQLRAFSGMILNKTGNQKMSITAVAPEQGGSDALDKFQTMEALLWKLACWTSKGRYPEHLDIDSPVYLKHWPNFTRLLVTPHAMRIAASLIAKPRTVKYIVHTLHTKPEYVFVFISAASALGLIGQAPRSVETPLEPEPLQPEPESNKKQGVLGRIISKLRAN